jgi:hypothetical protein
MNETKRRLSAVVVLTGILLLGVLTLSTGIASAENSKLSEQITAEELFELLSGNWSFNGTMTIGEQAMPTIGTRTVSLTGPTTADFVVLRLRRETRNPGIMIYCQMAMVALMNWMGFTSWASWRMLPARRVRLLLMIIPR